MKSILLFFLLGLSGMIYSQQCTILYIADYNSCSSVQYHSFDQGWTLQNISSGCVASNYYLRPFGAEYYDTGTNTWEPYSGMNFEFHRTSPPNQTNLDQSDRFTIDPNQQINFCINFNVSPDDNNRQYRVYFDIYDNSNTVLPPLSGGRLYTEFMYNGPNLIIQSESLDPTSVCAGNNIEMSANLVNIGDGKASSSTVQFWYSTDNNLGGSDELIASATISSVKPGESIMLDENGTIPSDASPSTDYIFFIADAQDQIDETNELDNEEIESFTVTTANCVDWDFFVQNGNVPSSAFAGQEISISCQQWSNSNASSNEVVTLGYVLSNTCDLNGIIELMETDNSTLGIDDFDNETENMDVPFYVSSGNYKILLVADYPDDYGEVNENNNISCHNFSITLDHDITTNNHSIDNPTVVVGEDIIVSCTQNYSGSTEQLVKPDVGYFLSTDAIYSGNDIYLGDDGSSLNVGTPSQNEGGNLDVDNNLTAGDYYFLFVADYLDEVPEIDEGNNVVAVPVTLLPDVTLSPPRYHSTSNSSYGGDPVDLATGAFILTEEDLSISGINGEFTWRRYYNSDLDREGALGWNWTHTYDISLDVDGSEWNVLHGNGKTSYFIGYSDGSSQARYRGNLDTLYLNTTENKYYFQKQDGTEYKFNSNGSLDEISNRQGNKLTFTYASGNLSSVIVPGGRSILISYNNGLISSVQDALGRSVTYSYNPINDLIQINDVRGFNTVFTYDGSHRIKTITDPNGNLILNNQYDSEGKVVSQLDPLQNSIIFEYDTPSNGYTKVTNQLMGTQFHRHDSNYRMFYFINELDDDMFFGYDGDSGKIKNITNENGKTTFFSIDDEGNIALIQDPEINQTTFTYNTENLPLTITNSLGEITTLTYDSNGNPTNLILPNGGSITATYNSNGQISTQTSPNGNLTTYSYNTFGDLISMGTPTGSYTFTHDNIGRIVSVTDRNQKTTSFTLDNSGNIVTIIDAENNSVSMSYDNNGNLLSYTDKIGNVTTLTYDKRNLITSIIDALMYKTSFEYDKLSRLTKVVDAKNDSLQYSYDARGQLISKTDGLGSYNYTYDAAGNLLTFTDALSNEYTFEYDNNNRLVEIIDPLSFDTDYEYDALNRIIEIKDALNRVTQYRYNIQGQIDSIIDPMGGIVNYNFDLEGNLVNYTDANGFTTTNSFNSLNLPVITTYPGMHTKTFTYDNEGNLLSKTDENGLQAMYTYNDIYDLIQVSYSNGTNYNYSFDAESRMTSMSNINGSVSFVRDERGLVSSHTDQFGYTTAFEYDGVGNRTKTTYPGGYFINQSYNEINLPTSSNDGGTSNYSVKLYDANGNISNILNGNGSGTNITRDEMSRIIRHVNFHNVTDTISDYQLTYDGVSNTTSIIAKTYLRPDYDQKDITLTHGDDDRLNNEGSNTIIRNSNGARTSVSGNYNQTIIWGENDQVLSYTTNGLTTTNSYNALQHRIEKQTASGTTKYALDLNAGLSRILQERDNTDAIINEYAYGPDGLMWKKDTQGNAQYYQYDFMGHTVALTDSAGNITDHYANDPFGAYLNHSGPTDQPFTFLGRYGVEHEGNNHYHIRAREYQADLGRFWSKDIIPLRKGTQGTNRYIYASNNPYKAIDINGMWEQSSESALVGQGSVVGFSDEQLSMFDELSLNTTIEIFSPPSTADELPDIEEYVENYLPTDVINNEISQYTKTNPNSYDEIYPEDLYALGQPELQDHTLEMLMLGLTFSRRAIIFGYKKIVRSKTLSPAVAKNYKRFMKKIPANSKSSATYTKLKNGNYLFEATSPGIVPGSRAVYQKWVDKFGKTYKVLKTTYGPDGKIIHIKNKM